MKAIVTVSLPPNPKHHPWDKKVGKCPIDGRICTDITGSHHSYIEEGATIHEIHSKAKKRFHHVTRIEVIDVE